VALPDRHTRPIDNQLDGFAVEDHIGFLLRRAHQRHAALFVGGMAHAELTPTQFAALIKLVELGQATQNHLGRLTAMDPATIQGVVHRLMARGLLRRSHDPMDRRTAVLQPTEVGVALITSVVASARKIHAAALAPLSDEEQRQLVALLRKMV
jgi:DNA-binding MarR family transcriptional regulator